MKTLIAVLIISGAVTMTTAGINQMGQVIAGLIIYYAGVLLGVVKVIDSMKHRPDEH